MRQIFGVFLVVAALSGCESNEAKLTRLKQAEAVSSLSVWYYQKLADSAYHSVALIEDGAAPALIAHRDSVMNGQTPITAQLEGAKVKHDLALRDLNRFMSGR